MKRFITSSSTSAPAKPISGLNNRPDNTFCAWLQSTPEVPPSPRDSN